MMQKTKENERKKGKVPEGYKEAIDLILRAWIVNGRRHLISGEDGKMIKKLLWFYGQTTTLALLHFFADKWEGWGRKTQGLCARGFWSDLPKMIEDDRLKVFEQRYQSQIAPKVAEIVNLKPVTVPEKSLTQKKLEVLKAWRGD